MTDFPTFSYARGLEKCTHSGRAFIWPLLNDSMILSLQASCKIKRAKLEKKVNSNILNKCICLFPVVIIRGARKENNAITK